MSTLNLLQAHRCHLFAVCSQLCFSECGSYLKLLCIRSYAVIPTLLDESVNDLFCCVKSNLVYQLACMWSPFQTITYKNIVPDHCVNSI